MKDDHSVRALLAVVVVAVGVRLHLLITVPPILRYDSSDYVCAAQEIAATGSYGNSQLAPLYPLLLNAVFLVFGRNHLGLLCVQHLLGLGSAVLVFFTARQIFQNRWAPVLAGLAVAADFTLAQYANMVLTESLFFFCINLLVLLFVTAYRKSSPTCFALLGLAIVAAQLTRPAATLIVACVPVGLLLAGWGLRRLARPTAVCVGSWLAAMLLSRLLLPSPGNAAGEALYYRVVNRAHLTAPGSPEFEVIKPYIDGADTGYGVIYHALKNEAGMTPAEAERVMLRAALAAIRANPRRFLASQAGAAWYLLHRSNADRFHVLRWINIEYYAAQVEQYATPQLLRLFPIYGDVRYSAVMVARLQSLGGAVDSLIFPLFAFSLCLYIGLHLRRERPLLIPVTLIAYFTLVTITFSGPLTRYRSAFDSLTYLVIAYGLSTLLAPASWKWLAAAGRRMRRSASDRPEPCTE